MGRDTLDHGSGQGGFASTHLAGQQDKTALAVQTVLEVSYGLAVIDTGIEKPGIRDNREGLSLKCKVLQINAHSPSLR